MICSCCSCCSDADAMIFSCLDSDWLKKRVGGLVWMYTCLIHTYAFFDGPASAVRHNGQLELTDMFNVGSGTGQGDIQRPPVFNVVLNLAVYLTELNKGISHSVVLVLTW